MVNKNYFALQDTSYSRTNVFLKINIMIEVSRGFLIRKTSCDNFEGLFFKTGEITTGIILPVKFNSTI